jgi:SAM-dependent methyltransferase
VPQSAGYNPVHFAPLAAIEEEHFWFAARRKLILAIVQKLSSSLNPGYRVLEIGCGTGNVLGALEEACPSGVVMGMDRFLEGLSFAKKRGRQRLIQGDAHYPPFGIQFEIIGAFDVIEHLSDDGQILRDMHRMLRPGGRVILTVPANQWLWSEFDEASDHCRRYDRKELREKLRVAGFTSIFVSPFMMSILPLVWMHRKKAKKNSQGTVRRNVVGEEIRIVPFVNPALRLVLSLENAFVRRGKHLPFGTSLIAVARKA